MEVAIQSNRKLLRNLIQQLQGVQESLFQKEPIPPIQYDQKCIAKKKERGHSSDRIMRTAQKTG
jgi:hypothetical protein